MIDPAITTNFWFTTGSGKLKVGKKVIWELEIHLNLVADKFPKEVFDSGKLREMYGDVVKE